MDAFVTRAQSISLSDDELLSLCKGKVNIVNNKNLDQYSSIDELLGEHGAAVILYETKSDEHSEYGHWTLLLRQSDSMLEWFDSYGLKVDSELKFIPEHHRIETKQFGVLLKLIEDPGCPYKVVWSQEQLQSKDSKIETCGRWCGARVILRSWSLWDFQRLFKMGPWTPDFAVTSFTMLACCSGLESA